MHTCFQENTFNLPISRLASRYGISTRTLQRYFDATTSISSKQALQIMRIRKALQVFVDAPAGFPYSDFGYYDYSHFYRHIMQFLQQHTTAGINSPLELLNNG